MKRRKNFFEILKFLFLKYVHVKYVISLRFIAFFALFCILYVDQRLGKFLLSAKISSITCA